MKDKRLLFGSENEFHESGTNERFHLPVMNQEMLYNIFSKVPAILCIVRGPDFIYEFANDHYKNLIGKGNLIGKKLGEVLPEMKKNWLMEGLQGVYNTNEPINEKQVKLSFPREGGEDEIIYLDINCQVYYGENEIDKRVFIFAYNVTEQVKAGKLKAFTEKKFRNLFYNSPTAVYTCNVQGKIILYNEALVELCGRVPDLENDLWCPVKNIFLPDGTPLKIKNWKHFYENKSVNREGVELTVELFNGTQRAIMLYPESISEENEEPEGYINTMVDISGQVHARKELEAVTKVIESLYLDAPAFICTLRGPDHIYELVNPAYQSIFGRIHLNGQKFFEVSPELKDQSFFKLLNHVYTTGKPFVATEQLFNISKDINQAPQVTYLNFSVQPIHDSGNKISGLVIFGYDVTELVLTRQKGEENLKKILESLPQITSISSAEGKDIYFNNFFYEYSGLTKEEATVNGWNSIMCPDGKEDLIKEWEECKKKDIEYKRELRLKRNQDGMYRWHIVNLTPVKNHRNEVLNWVASAIDIHEQKWKDEKKDEFLSIASHELKTPLTSVKAYLQLIELSMEKVDPEIKLYCQRAIVSVDRLGNLISELLDVSKIQQQNLNLNITAFDFNEMLNRVIENGRFSTTQHEITASGFIEKKIEADRERIEQVVNNLLNNAIKYSPDGGGISIKLSTINDKLQLSISDHGIGISSYDLEKVFDRYFRAAGHGLHFQGLGIGLFISMEIIRLHGGDMWASSTLGKGTTFTFLIPMYNHILNNR
ncbi:MAG: PAS domain S-box protein [Ginsengibacter sp.]